MAGTHAALAVRGNAIYLFYVTDRNPSGTLSAISSQPPSSSSSTSNTASPIASSGPFIPASASSFSEQNYGQDDIDGQVLAAEPAIAPTAPNSGDGNNLYMQPQAISLNSVAPGGGGGQVTRLSMVSTSSLVTSTSTYRHDLLLAYNSGTQLPLLFRLTPKSPGTGNGLQSSSPPGSPQWSFDLSPLQPLAPASYLCLATGISGGRPIDNENEGTTVYQLVAAGPTFVPQFRIIDVYDSGRPTVAPGPGLPFISIQPNLNPVVVRLKNNDQVDTVVIGVSATSPLATAIQINSDLLQLSSLMSVPGRFDSTACYTDGNGQLIKATQQFIQSLSVTSGSGLWIDRKTPVSNNLPSPILACASIDKTLFAVLEGPTGPVIYTADMSSPTEWVWQERQLINISNGNTSGGGNGGIGGALPVDSSDRNSKGLSTGGLVGIIAVVIIVLGGVLFWVLWRRRRASGGLKSRSLGGSGGAEKITVRPPLAPPPQPGAGLLHQQQHAYSPVFSENSATAAIIPGQVRYMSSQSLGQQPVVSMSPQMNYHQPTTSSAAPGWTTAVYPTGSGISQPGEYIPMVASSLSTAPPPPISTVMYGAPVTASSIPSTPGYSHAASPVVFGDKQELTSEDTSVEMQSASSAVGTQQNQQQGAASPTDTNNTLVPSGAARNDARMQEMFSPTLANAQLILQRSQSPPNQIYQELPPPQQLHHQQQQHQQQQHQQQQHQQQQYQQQQHQQQQQQPGYLYQR